MFAEHKALAIAEPRTRWISMAAALDGGPSHFLASWCCSWKVVSWDLLHLDGGQNGEEDA